MDEIDKEANQEVKALNSREETSEQTDFHSLAGTINHQRWLSVWFMEGTDKKEVLTHIAEKCERLIVRLSKEERRIYFSADSMKIDSEGDTDESVTRFS